MSTWARIAGLPLQIDGYALDGRELDLGPFVRKTTLIRLRGGGEEGVGEDVVYDPEAHDALQRFGPALELAGDWTLESFSTRLDELDLFPEPPEREDSRDYRRWAFESAALDLALRQAGTSLAEAVGREPRRVEFVVSMRLGSLDSSEPETTERLRSVLERYPRTRFKLDPTNNWTQDLVDELAGLGVVDSLDLKGFYRGTPVDVVTDPGLYRMVLEGFPDAWIEDPDVTDGTRALLEPHADRITWDAPIHSVADIEARPWRPRMVNIKPSRFGRLQNLFDTYDWCAEQGIGAYGGGQTELGEGRGQIQYLASLFHPDTPNDTAPGGYNQVQTPDGLPQSPLEPRPAPVGFRWETG